MNRVKAILLSAACAVLFGSVALAQTPKQIPKPRDFKSKPVFATRKAITNEMMLTLTSGKFEEEWAAQYWDAYSDRDNNSTYVDSKCKKTLSTLSFKEKVRIADIRGNAALVYSIPMEGLEYPALPATFDWKGWIPLSNLVLTDVPLSDSKGQFQKAVLSQDALGRQSDASAIEGRLFTTPVNPTNYTSLPGSSTTSLYYVVKSEGSMVLLSHDSDLTNPDNIFGWVSVTSLQLLLNGRLFLEPTWEVANVEAFARAGTSVDITDFYNNSLGVISFTEPGGDVYDETGARLPKDEWRFPFISKWNSGRYGIAVPTGSKFLSSRAGAAADMSEDLNNVNIMFVLDGSNAYVPYLTALIDRIKQLRNITKYSSIKVGYVIYRDASTAEYSTEIFPLSDVKNRTIIDYLDRGGEYGFKGNFVQPLLCAGIETAIDNAGFHASESNYMIVLGGSGDLSDSKSSVPANIAAKLDSQNICLLGVQLQNYPTRYAYRLFNSQVTEMISSRISSRYEKIGSGEEVILQGTTAKDNLREVGFFVDGKENRLFDYHTYVAERMMDEIDFEELLKGMFDRIFANIDEQVSSKGGAPSEQAMTFHPASVLVTDIGKREFFKPVAMFAEDEFEDLMTRFEELYELALTQKDSYGMFLDKLGSWTTSVLPYNSSIKLEELGFYEALGIVEGVDYWPDSYKGKKFKDLQNLKGSSPEEFSSMMDLFAERYRKLLQVKNTPYRFTSTINGEKVYWIPMEYLP